ncbi:hypothetical protein CAP48_10520 [Advenella sp. S44]|nr:hypothetical protein CAP48_10520 [Advenella sp. S44]
MNIVSKSIFAAAFSASLWGAIAQAQTVTPAKKENSQQSRMAVCNANAKSNNLQGDARKSFMKACLSTSKSKDGKALSASQQRMVDCSRSAKAKSLSGQDRKTFMSDCLKNA